MYFDLNSALSVLIIISQIVVSVILNNTIKSKDSIIGDLKVLLEGTDIKRLTEYYKAVDHIREKSIIAQTNLELNRYKDSFEAETVSRFDEMATFISSFIVAMPKDERLDIIRRHMPTCEELFTEYLDAPESPSFDNGKND